MEIEDINPTNDGVSTNSLDTSSNEVELDNRTEEVSGGTETEIEGGGGGISSGEITDLADEFKYYYIKVIDSSSGLGISGYNYTVYNFDTDEIVQESTTASTSNTKIITASSVSRIYVQIIKSGYSPLVSSPITGQSSLPSTPEQLSLIPTATSLSISLSSSEVSIPRTGGSAVVSYTITSGSLNAGASGINYTTPSGVSASLNTVEKTITITVSDEIEEGAANGLVRVRFTDSVYGTNILKEIAVVFTDSWIKAEKTTFRILSGAYSTTTNLSWQGITDVPSLGPRPTWISVSLSNISTVYNTAILNITVDENKTPYSRTGRIIIRGTTDSGDIVDLTLTVAQAPPQEGEHLDIEVEDVSYPNYANSYTVRYTITAGYTSNSKTISTPSWITDCSTNLMNKSISFKVLENTSTADRTGTIVFALYDTFYSEWVNFELNITQHGKAVENIYIPSWKDEYYEFTEATTFTITEGNKTIYTGYTVINPKSGKAIINVSSIIRNYVGSSIKFQDPIECNYSDKKFTLYSSDGVILGCYVVHNDWSYDTSIDYDSDDFILSDPINGHFDYRMKFLFTGHQIAETAWSITQELEGGTEITSYPDPDFSDNKLTNTSIYTGATTNTKSVSFSDAINSISYNVPVCGARYVLYYRNRKGGYDSFVIEGNCTKKDTYNRATYISSYNNNNPLDFGTINYHKDITRTWTLYTGWLSDEESEKLSFNLLPTSEIYLHDLQEDIIKSVIITNSTADYKTFKSNGRKMVNYELTITESQLTTIN